ESASTIIGSVMSLAVSRSLDATLLDTAAADATRPAGLLNGVTPVTATAGGGLSALALDIANLIGAIADAKLDADNAVIVTNPRQAVKLKTLPPSFSYPIFSSPQIPAGRVIAVVPDGVFTGYLGSPEIETSKVAEAHFANPAAPISATAMPTY